MNTNRRGISVSGETVEDADYQEFSRDPSHVQRLGPIRRLHLGFVAPAVFAVNGQRSDQPHRRAGDA